MTTTGLVGRVFGPAALQATPAAVETFAAATGDETGRWVRPVPPGFAAVALFAVAPALLADPEVSVLSRSLLHAEQDFAWERALEVGEALEVTGRVAAVRERGSLHLVDFEMAAGGASGPWASGRSVFLLSAEAAAAAAEEAEPRYDFRGPNEPAQPRPLPEAGDPLPPLARSASRADLIRYAAAGGDFNPIHWDHEAARGAGLPGVVAHGLLLTSWLCQAAGRFGAAPSPLARLAVRFRRPLRPGTAALIEGRVAAVEHDGAELDLTLASAGDVLASAAARVTR